MANPFGGFKTIQKEDEEPEFQLKKSKKSRPPKPSGFTAVATPEAAAVPKNPNAASHDHSIDTATAYFSHQRTQQRAGSASKAVGASILGKALDAAKASILGKRKVAPKPGQPQPTGGAKKMKMGFHIKIGRPAKMTAVDPKTTSAGYLAPTAAALAAGVTDLTAPAKPKRVIHDIVDLTEEPEEPILSKRQQKLARQRRRRGANYMDLTAAPEPVSLEQTDEDVIEEVNEWILSKKDWVTVQELQAHLKTKFQFNSWKDLVGVKARTFLPRCDLIMDIFDGAPHVRQPFKEEEYDDRWDVVEEEKPKKKALKPGEEEDPLDFDPTTSHLFITPASAVMLASTGTKYTGPKPKKDKK